MFPLFLNSYTSTENFSTNPFRKKDYIYLACLPWKQTEIILSFLRLYPSTAFRTLLLTMMATPFLLRDSYTQ